MVKPKVFGRKYIQAQNLARNGEAGPWAKAQVENLSTANLYGSLKMRGWEWDSDVQEWLKVKKESKKPAKKRSTVFGDLPVSQHLAVRIVAQSEKIDNIIESTRILYEMLDCTLLSITGPVPAQRGTGKSMAYLYFALPK